LLPPSSLPRFHASQGYSDADGPTYGGEGGGSGGGGSERSGGGGGSERSGADGGGGGEAGGGGGGEGGASSAVSGELASGGGAATRAEGGSSWRPPDMSGDKCVRLIMDGGLAALSRKLRMVGIDAQVALIRHTHMPLFGTVCYCYRPHRPLQVAGEGLRAYSDDRVPGLTARQGGGLRRVTISQERAEAQFRRAAAEGRLLLAERKGARKAAEKAAGGAVYQLLATDPDAQFAEVVEVLGLQDALTHGESRCGVCNSRAWRTLLPADVEGRVPAAVSASEDVFYECGFCEQLFWPGAKYTKTMDSLATTVGVAAGGEQAVSLD